MRFLMRALGLCLVAAGFVGLVVDATRSIANRQVSFFPLGELALALFPRQFPTIEPFITRQIHPALWDPVLLGLFSLPAAVCGVVLGALLLWLGQQPPEPIGYRLEP